MTTIRNQQKTALLAILDALDFSGHAGPASPPESAIYVHVGKEFPPNSITDAQLPKFALYSGDDEFDPESTHSAGGARDYKYSDTEFHIIGALKDVSDAAQDEEWLGVVTNAIEADETLGGLFITSQVVDQSFSRQRIGPNEYIRMHVILQAKYRVIRGNASAQA